MRLECPCPHGQPRRPMCRAGAECRMAACTMLHPERGAGLLAAKALSGRRPLWQRQQLQCLRAARFAHEAKMAEAKDAAYTTLRSSTVFGGVIAPAQAAAEADVHEAQAKELWEQLHSFDIACTGPLMRCIELGPLVPVAAKGKGKGSLREQPYEQPKDDKQHEQQESAEREQEAEAIRHGQSADDQSDSETGSKTTTATPATTSRGPNPEDRDRLARLRREVCRLQAALPALARRGELCELLAKGERRFVVRGATGSGKSTQMTQFLAEELCGPNASGKICHKILCTQPRKVAVLALAARVAEEWSAGNEKLAQVGGTVGYRVGGFRKVAPWTQIEYMTEGTLLQMLMRKGADALRGVRAVILDEAHERSVRLDLLLGWLYKMQLEQLPDLCLVVTSATLDVQLFSHYLQDCAVLEIAGRMFPVEDIYEAPSEIGADIQQVVVKKAFDIHRSHPLAAGDILAFLPDPPSVESAREQLDNLLQRRGESDYTVFCLHGGQEPDEQQKVFQRCPGLRKIIFSTSVAETSVTIDGVCFVVDSGVEKKVIYDAKRNLSSLEVVTISRSSAVQRRGRSGRTAPGVCYRMYSADDFDAMQATQAAEVLSQPAHLTLLTLLSMNLDPDTFHWLEKPSEHALRSSWATLLFLCAVEKQDGHWALTEFGKLAAGLQIDPCLAKVLHEGCRQGLIRQAADVVAVMSGCSNFSRKAVDDAARKQLHDAQQAELSTEGDVVTMYRFYRKWIVMKTANLDGLDQQHGCQAASAFARETWLRGRELERARTTSVDFVKQLGKLGFEPAQDGRAAEDELSESQLLDLILAGCFLSLGLLSGGRGPSCRDATYQMVGSSMGQEDAVTAGAVFPGSVLARQDGSAPKFLCFTSMMQTSKLFLFGVTVLRCENAEALAAKIKQFSPSFAQHLGEVLPTMVMDKVECDGFTVAALTGNRARQNRLDLQDRFACTVFYDHRRGAVCCVCRPQHAHALRLHVEDLRRSYQDSVQKEVCEELVGGNTRAVYGRGGEVAVMLYPDECITVNCFGLPAGTPEADFRVMMELYGDVRSAVVMPSLAPSGGNVAADVFCQATFVDKAAAQMALQKFREHCPDLVNIRPGGIRAVCSNQDITGCLKIQWDITEQLSDEDAAADTLAIVVSQLRRLVPLGDQAEFQSFFSERIASNGAVKGKGRGKGQGKVAQAETIKMAGFRVTYPGGVETLRQAFASWSPSAVRAELEQEGLATRRMVGSLDCTVCYQAALSVHRAVFEHFQAPCRNDLECRFSDCTLQHNGRRRPNCHRGMQCTKPKEGEARCKFLHPRAWHGAAPEDANADGGPVAAALLRCYELGVKAVVFTKGQSTTIRLEHNRPEQLQDCRLSLVSALGCDVFTEAGKDLLFQPPGIRRLEKAQQKTKAYIHWDKASRTVRIFGRPDERRDALQFLHGAVQELAQLRAECFLLQAKVLKDLRADRSLLENLAHACRITEHHRLYGSSLNVWAREQEIELFRSSLSERGWLRRPVVQVAIGTADLCGLCMCEFDESTCQLEGCGHRFCTACLKGALSNPDGTSFPVACPQPLADAGGMCRQPLVWRDLVLLCSPEVLARVKGIAVDTFVRERKAEALYCPKPGCNHILKPPQPLPEHGGEQRRLGGLLSHCELCNFTYCLQCTEKMGEPQGVHWGCTCLEVQRDGDPGVKRHRSHIVNEFLTLRCPRCKRAFDDYSGCAALTCDNCNCGFCAKCFEDCGTDAHAHCNDCTGPPFPHIRRVPVGYFLSTPDFHHKNLALASYRVQEYLDSLAPDLRKAVFEACRADFTGRPGGDLDVKA